MSDISIGYMVGEPKVYALTKHANYDSGDAQFTGGSEPYCARNYFSIHSGLAHDLM